MEAQRKCQPVFENKLYINPYHMDQMVKEK